jgi:hypothetical protein
VRFTSRKYAASYRTHHYRITEPICAMRTTASRSMARPRKRLINDTATNVPSAARVVPCNSIFLNDVYIFVSTRTQLAPQKRGRCQ